MNRVFIHLRVLLHCGWCLNISSFSSTSLVILFHSVDPFHSPDSIFPGTPFNRDINIPICFILWGLSSSSRHLFHSFPSRSASSSSIQFSAPASFLGVFHPVLGACFILSHPRGLPHSLGPFIQYSVPVSFPVSFVPNPVCFIRWGLSSSTRRLFHFFPSRSDSFFLAFHSVLSACFVPCFILSHACFVLHDLSVTTIHRRGKGLGTSIRIRCLFH